MKYNTGLLKSNLCDYNDVYILLRGDITTYGRILPTEVAHSKIVDHLLSVSQKLMEQQHMTLKI